VKSICIIVQSYYEVDIRVRRKAEALVAAGHSVDVLALRQSSTSPKAFDLNGVSVHTIALGKKRGSLVRYFFEYFGFLIWAFFKLFRLMRKRPYAIVDVNNLPDFLVFAAVYAKWKGAKVVFDMHEITPEFYICKYGIGENSWMVRLLKRIEKASFDFADHVIAINEPILELLASRGLPLSKCTVIMNSVDEAMFKKGAAAVAGGISPRAGEGFTMMYHGTLTRIYGLDIAIEAFARVHKQMPGAEFLILGDGPEKNSLESLCRQHGLMEKVRLLGFVQPKEVRQWLSRCDIGVLPTRRDIFLDYSFSNKLPEYIIMGKGVIVSRLKTIQYYFTSKALAYFEPNNPEDLAAQMLRLYQDRGLSMSLALQAKKEYAPICWEVMKERYLRSMNQLLGVETRVVEKTVETAVETTVETTVETAVETRFPPPSPGVERKESRRVAEKLG